MAGRIGRCPKRMRRATRNIYNNIYIYNSNIYLEIWYYSIWIIAGAKEVQHCVQILLVSLVEGGLCVKNNRYVDVTCSNVVCDIDMLFSDMNHHDFIQC